MLKPILYKEWIKTRWYFLLAILVSIGFTGYSLLRVNRVIGLKGMEHLWQVMLERDVIFIDLQMYIPLIIGILLAIVQFVPEIQPFEADIASSLSSLSYYCCNAAVWYIGPVSMFCI